MLICNLSSEVQAMFNIGECHMDTTERSTIIDVLWLYLQSVRRKTLASKMLPAHYRLSEPHMLYLTAEVERSPRHMVALDEVILFHLILLPPSFPLYEPSHPSHFCGKTDQSLQIAAVLPLSGLRTFFHLL